MQSLTLKIKTGTSKIYFANEFFLSVHKNSLVVFDSNTERLFSKYFIDNNSFTFKAGELSKNINTIQSILQVALEKNLNRQSIFYGVGGGVVCDLTAFSASVFKRGVKLILVPTSLLAMVDASIGGKTGFDFCGIKNSIGTFFYAKEVFVFFDVLKSLEYSEYKNGLAEILKIGMIGKKKILKLLLSETPDKFFNVSETLKNVIYLSVKAKLKIVEKDFTEKNIRMLLNLGHTFAHALESLTEFSMYSHGEAVAWGIAQALKLGLNLKITDKAYAKKIFTILNKFDYKMEFYDAELMQRLKLSSFEFCNALLERMTNDKKNSDENITFIVPKKACQNLIYKINKSTLSKILTSF